MTDARVARLTRFVMSTATQGDVLRLLGLQPLTARQLAWRLNARADDLQLRLDKMLSRGLIHESGRRRLRSGRIEPVYSPGDGREAGGG